MNLVEEITTKYKAQTGKAVADFFEAVNMPIPNKGEYTIAVDTGFLVFLDEPACVLRGSNRWSCPQTQNSLVLQPLLTRPVAKDFRIDIFPGVVTPVKDDDMLKLKNKMKDSDVVFSDASTRNAGYLPTSNVRFPDGIPVVIDMGSLFKMNKRINAINRLLNPAFKNNANDLPHEKSVFSDLQTAFAHSWPKDADKPDQTLLSKAWKLCAMKKKETVTLLSGREQTVLTADWQNMGEAGKEDAEYKNAKNGGARYAQRWQISRDM